MPGTRRTAFQRTTKFKMQQQTASPGTENAGGSPHEPLTTIPLTTKKGRADGRKWEIEHPSSSYYIPDHLLDEAKDVRDQIKKHARETMASTTNIARVLMEYALGHVRKGELIISARPNPNRRKMTVMLIEANDWPKQKNAGTPQPKKYKVDRTGKCPYLGYRWGADIDKQVGALAGDALSKGEVVVFLLHYALSAYDKGYIKFIAHPVQAKQSVTLASG